MSCGAETEANTLLTALLVGEDVTLPAIDFEDFEIPEGLLDSVLLPVAKLTNEDLTTGQLSGSGTFDVLMRAFKAHLQVEFDKGRITGTEYTKAYIALTESAMAQGVNFLVNRDQAYWAAVTAQLGALQARTILKTAQMQLVTAKFEAVTSKANFGLTKLKISSESMAYCTAKYGLENMLPQQLTLLREQTEAQRAQTLGTRSDGAAVTGVLGKQVALYTQQITSYQRDAEVKAAKMWTDAWTTMKAIDEGLEPPTAFANATLNTIMQRVQTNNGLS
jgi:hypothetical protein